MRDNRPSFQEILLRTPSLWMDGSGQLSEVVISSRVRLARNLKDVPFPHLLKEPKAEYVLDQILDATDKMSEKDSKLALLAVRLKDVQGLDRQVLVEKHLISPIHAQTGLGKGLALSSDEKVSIMVNEEDHLRIQCLNSGLELEEAWITAQGLDDILDSQLGFAYDGNLGYLTACPTNVGTGLRASLMVHLPGLALKKELERVIDAVNKLGFVVRGIYGEGTSGQGNVFQISNQITLGREEKEIIESLTVVAKQVIAEEKKARLGLWKSGRAEMEDRVMRSLGLLSTARIMSSGEAAKLWSDVRLGIDFGLMPKEWIKGVNEILVLAQPSFVQKRHGTPLSAKDRDVIRAKDLRNHLGKFPGMDLFWEV